MNERDRELALEAGLYFATDVNWMPIIGMEYAKKFAALIRADEREACAKMAEELNEIGHSYGLENRIRARGTND